MTPVTGARKTGGVATGPLGQMGDRVSGDCREMSRL